MSDSAITLSSAPSYFFEISDLSNGAVFTDTAIRSFMITCNRKYTLSGGDNVTTKYVSAVAAGLGGSVFPPRTQVKLPSLRNGQSIDSQGLEYFDVPYSITVLALDENNGKLIETHNVLKYVVQPKKSFLQAPIIGSSAGVITIDMPGKVPGSQFDTNGLKYMIQIDGPNAAGDYKSRNYIVDASNVDGSANFTTVNQNQESILNNNNFDVAVIALNSTGSENISDNVDSVLVSANANPPSSVSLSNEFNAQNSTARFTITIAGNPVPGDADRKYVLFIASLDASGTNLLSGANAEIDASLAPISVTTSQLGLDSVLVPNVQYLVKVAAKNSTGNASAYTENETITPESKPSDLSIAETLVRLQADPTDPSGKIKVVLASGFKRNGTNVSLYAIAADVSGATGTQSALNTAINSAINNRIEIPDASLNNNSFVLTQLQNGHDYVIGVTLENDNDTNLKLTTFANASVNSNGDYSIVAGQLVQPGTALQKPEIKEIVPLDGSFSELGSGNAQVKIGFPEGSNKETVDGTEYIFLNNDYTDYKVWVEDETGNHIYTDPSWISFYLENYKAKGFKWVDQSDNTNVVVIDSSINAPEGGLTGTGGWAYDGNGPIYNKSVNGKHYVGKDANGDYLTIPVNLSGLNNSKKYIAKAQMRVNSEETTVVDTEQYLRSSTYPVLDSANASYIGGIFDLTNKFLEYDDVVDTSYVKFSKKGINQILENASNNGYDINAVNVAFYAEDSNIIQGEKRRIHKVFRVNKPDDSVGDSYNGTILFTGSGYYELNTSSNYSVAVVPQNSVYKQDETETPPYADVQTLLDTPGLINTDNIKLSSEILEVSGNVLGSSTVVNGDLYMNIAFQVADDSDDNSTKFKSVDIVLSREIPMWDETSSQWSWVPDENYESPDLKNITVLGANRTVSRNILIPEANYGWRYSINVTVNSSPGGQSNGVVYSAAKPEVQFQPTRKPTITLDASAVEIKPNGAAVTVDTIDLIGTSVTENNVNLGQSLKYNSFMFNNAIESLAAHGFTHQLFTINVDQTLQIHAYNSAGRTTLTNETRFTVEVLSDNATLVSSPNDGTFELNVDGKLVQFRLQLQP